MKIKDGYMLCKVASNNVVVSTGEAVTDFDGLVTLNDTGVFIWKILQKGCDYDELIEKMVSEYDIDEHTAQSDANEFIDKLKGAGFLE